MFLLGVFLLLVLSVLWRINATNVFDWLFVDGEKLCQKKLRINMTIKKYNMACSLSIMVYTLVQVKSSLSIVEIYVDQHFKNEKDIYYL